MKKCTYLIVGLIVFAVGAAVCSAQSLGEIAKKAAAERAAKAAAAEKDGKTAPLKILTDKDVKPDINAPTPKPEPDTASAAAKPEKPKEEKAVVSADPPKDEAYWKSRMRILQSKLADDQNELTIARVHVVDVEAFIRPDGTMSSTIAENLLKAQARRDKAIAAIANDKRVISDLEEEARRAGVPPGWLRW